MEQSHFYKELIGQTETQCYTNYRTMIINQMSGRVKYTSKMRQSIERDLHESLGNLIGNTREKLQRYGLIETLYRREINSLEYLGLSQMMPTDRTMIEDNVLSPDSLRLRTTIEQIAINLFWINKYWKAMGNCKSALWVMNTHNQSGNGKSNITDQEKYLAIKREQVLDYSQQLVDKSGEDITFEQYIMYLYAKRTGMSNGDNLEIATEKVKGMSPELRKELEEIEEKYNAFFEKDSIAGGQFINDGLYNLYMLYEKINVQTIKDILTRQLIELLVIDSKTTFPKYNSWGIIEDAYEKGPNRHLLIIDIPGAIKPLQVHVPHKLIEDGEGKLPTYKGIYARHEGAMEKARKTYFLFYPNSEQAKFINQKLRKRKENYRKNPSKTEVPFIRMLEYMNAVVGKQMGQLSYIMEDDEGTR